MDQVFLLWHVHEFDNGDQQEMLIGVYQSREAAQAAIVRVSAQPGFQENPNGFEICLYRLDEDHWTEGYVNS